MNINANENPNSLPVISTEETNKAGLIVQTVQPQVEFEDGADDELLYGEDTAGKSLEGMPLAAKASVPTLITFKVMGEIHKAEVVYGNVTYEARRAPDEAAENVSVKHGIIDPEANPTATLEAQRSLEEDRNYQGARVALALQACKRDSKGRFRVSVPLIREADAKQLTNMLCAPTPEQEIYANYVRAFVSAVNRSVNDFFNPSDPISMT